MSYYPSPNLDVLRSLAVIFVVTSHLLLNKSSVRWEGYDAQTLGTLGVLIFFVHTCLVLMLSLERQEGTRNGSTAMSFLVARAFRIYPLAIVVIVLLSLIELMHSGVGPGLPTFLSNILLIQNLTRSPSITPVLWSLPFELQMYLFLPFLYMLTRRSRKHSASRVAVLWCICIVVVLVFWQLGLDYNLIKFFPCFLPGVLAFCLLYLPRKLSPTVLFSYVSATAIIYPLLVGRGVNASLLSWLFCLGLGLLIPRCREIRSNLMAKASSVIARYSYGIYLVHDPVRYLSFHYLKGLSPFVSWSIFIFAVCFLAYIAYHFIEKPGIEIGRAFVTRFKVNRLQASQRPE